MPRVTSHVRWLLLVIAACSMGKDPAQKPPPAPTAPAVVAAPWCEWSLDCSATADTQPGPGAAASIHARLSLSISGGAERADRDPGRDTRPLPVCSVVAIGAGRLVPAAVHDGAAELTVPAGRYVLRFDSCYGCRIRSDGEQDLEIRAAAGTRTTAGVLCTEIHK